MCAGTDSCTPDESIHHGCHVSLSLQKNGRLRTAATTIPGQKAQGLDCAGRCRCLFSCHSLQPVLSLFPDSCLSLSALTHTHLSPLSPLSPPECGWPLGSTSLSPCVMYVTWAAEEQRVGTGDLTDSATHQVVMFSSIKALLLSSHWTLETLAGN